MELTIREAADLLGRSERTLRHLAQGGRLPARRIGARWVIRRDELEAWARAEGANGSTSATSHEAEASEDTETVDAAPAHETPPRSPPPSHTPANQAEPAFTVSFEAISPADSATHELHAARELDAFAIATDLLGELSRARRHPHADVSLLTELERPLLDFLQLTAEGAHDRDPWRQSERFREAQSRACAALSALVHYNIVHPQPDLSALAARVDGPLLAALRDLQAAAARRLTWRARLVTAAESFAHRLLDRARQLSHSDRMNARLDELERGLDRALRYAL